MFAKSLLLISLFSIQSFATIQTQPEDLLEWDRIEIPNTKCGNGEPYAIFVDEVGAQKSKVQRSKNVLFIFEAGGACQGQNCENAEDGDVNFAPAQKVRPFFSDKLEGILTGNDRISPYTQFSKIYLPYCTGDVHIGQHKTHYKGLGTVHHHGKDNVQRSFDFLKQNYFKFESTKNVTLYGFSAGALGALYHVKNFAPHFKNAEKKSVISDSPGLHFGNEFWQEFTQNMIDDYTNALAEVGYRVNTESGLMAAVAPKVCELLPSWNIGILHASKDWFMSDIFGRINQRNHHKLTVGEMGLPNLTSNPKDNCAAWVPNYGGHTFLHIDSEAMISINGKTAMQFSWDVTQGLLMQNYVGNPVSN